MQALRVEQDSDLLRVTMARPERRNAFDAELIAELTEAFGAVGDDVRAVLLAGDGPSFCAGADVDWMRGSIELSYDENVADARRLRKMLEAIDSCPAPVVARVQGHALGGGGGLVACADIAVAAPDAAFAFSRGEARDHPGSDLAVRAGEDRRRARRGATSSPASASTPRRRCGSGSSHEVADDLDAAVEAHRRRDPQSRPAGRAAGEEARARAAGRASAPSGAHRGQRRDERRGPGRPARVPREAAARVVALNRFSRLQMG